MNSILLCEGSTDYFLMQYYMRRVYGWDDSKNIQSGCFKMDGQKSRKLQKAEKFLTIAAVGGCGQLPSGLESALVRNKQASPINDDMFHAIVMLTDRDEISTEREFVSRIEHIFCKMEVKHENELESDVWINCRMENAVGENISFNFLLMIVPFEREGAMETFLLDAVASQNEYDKTIIEQCNVFVDGVDPEKRYLSKRRLVTKAKFDTYFSIRTPVKQFEERQDILKNVPWEDYTMIQTGFRLLENLG